MAVDWGMVAGLDSRLQEAVAVLVVGGLLGYLLGRVSVRVLRAAGVPSAVEGTSFERTARSLGTSTVALFSRLLSWFIYGVTVLLAFRVADLFSTASLWTRIGVYVPNLFFALFALAAGFVVGDKAELTTAERLSGLKVPQVSILPRLVKYSVVYVAALVALGQIGVATGPLLVLLLLYAGAAVLFTGLALRDVLPAAVAGYYLLLNEPFGIGDTIRIGDNQGVVQEMGVFVTHIEDDGKEFIVPNYLLFRDGVVRLRD